jgi:glycine cleavage system H lipoate-binding protein
MVPLTIVGIFLVLLATDMVIQYIQAGRGEEVYGFLMPDPPLEKKPAVQLNFSRVVDSLANFGILPPSNVFLHDGHTWAAVDESGEARIGVTALARKAIGRINSLELPAVGQTLRKGDKLFTVRQGERTAEFVAPIDGTVSLVNENASQGADLNPSDWICKISPKNLSTNLKSLRFAEDSVRWIYDELLNLHELVAMQLPRLQTVGVTMQDGPFPLDNLLESFDDETWNIFENRFLKRSGEQLEEK